MQRRTQHKPQDPHSHSVHAPGRRLLRRIPLYFVAKSAGGEKKRSVSASLNLVSFIDFLVVTVIFLPLGFAAGIVNVMRLSRSKQADEVLGGKGPVAHSVKDDEDED